MIDFKEPIQISLLIRQEDCSPEVFLTCSCRTHRILHWQFCHSNSLTSYDHVSEGNEPDVPLRADSRLFLLLLGLAFFAASYAGHVRQPPSSLLLASGSSRLYFLYPPGGVREGPSASSHSRITRNRQ